MEGEEAPYASISWILLKDGQQVIGGATIEVYDYIDRKQVLLELNAIWIKREYRRQGYGRKLLDKSIVEARRYYERYGLKAIGMIIETTSLDKGAKKFYKASFNFPYSMTTQKMAEIEVTLFLVSFSK